MIPLMSSANAQGHPGIVRSCVIMDLNERELIVLTFRLNVLENCCLTTKSKARVLHFLLGDQQQHACGGWEREYSPTSFPGSTPLSRWLGTSLG